MKVEGHGDLIRDPNTNGISNINKSEYEKYISKRNSKLIEKKKSEDMEKEIYRLRNDIDEIKSLLKKLSNIS